MKMAGEITEKNRQKNSLSNSCRGFWKTLERFSSKKFGNSSRLITGKIGRNLELVETSLIDAYNSSKVDVFKETRILSSRS